MTDNWIPVKLNWNEYPAGTKAKNHMGAQWVKTEHGWKYWNSHCSFPVPGDAMEVCLPEPTKTTTP